MSAIDAVGTHVSVVALCRSLGVSRAAVYRRRRPRLVRAEGRTRSASPRALAIDERKAVLDTLHSERFIDAAPIEVYPGVSQFWKYDPEQYMKQPSYSREFQGIKKA